jgi:hypothetical protein
MIFTMPSRRCVQRLLRDLDGAVAIRTEWGMVMDLIVDLYWSFRSPYSYIVLPRIIELRDRFGLLPVSWTPR